MATPGLQGTRAERVAVAQRLRAEGLLLREIAERMGVSLTTAGLYLSDPDLSQQRARRDRYQGSCERCGAPTDGSRGPGLAPRLCLEHAREEGLIGAARERAAQRRALVERLWAQGLTSRAIGEIVGWSPRSAPHMITKLRGVGYELPHRHPGSAAWHRAHPEAIAHARRFLHTNGEHASPLRTGKQGQAPAQPPSENTP